MPRDSLFGETILWSGAPVPVPLSTTRRLAIAICAALAAISLSFAAVWSTALHVSVSGLIFFAAWCAALGMAGYTLPRLWIAGLQFVITDKHVIWRRGPIRRTIDRDSISYALIRWNPRVHGVGDLVLVRAVPTGALRRTLRLTLSDVTAPDRVYSAVRGVTPGGSLGDGDCPLPQRLDEGERVLWSGAPALAPWNARRLATAAISATVGLAAVHVVERSIPVLRKVDRLHLLPGHGFAFFVAAVALAVMFMVVIAVAVGYSACVRPARLARATRYLVTDRRVLIRRAHDELSLDRRRIADVITAPTRSGSVSLIDVFLVLDGPHARAFASSGAFRHVEAGGLQPVLVAVEDAETVATLLRTALARGPLATAA
jgi:hypothetical protein